MAEFSQTPAPRPALRILRDEEAPAYDASPVPASASRSFGMIPREVHERATKGTQIAVYSALVLLRTRDGVVTASVQKIADLAKCSRTETVRALSHLIDVALVERTTRYRKTGGHGASEYRLPFHPTKTVVQDGQSVVQCEPPRSPHGTTAMVHPEPSINYKYGSSITSSSTSPPTPSADESWLEEKINGSMDDVVRRFEALHGSLDEKWMRSTLRRISAMTDGMERKQVLRCVGLAHQQIEDRYKAVAAGKGEPVYSPRGFAADMLTREFVR